LENAKKQVTDLLLVVEVGTLELWPAFYSIAWSRLGGRADLRSSEPVLTAGARCPPLSADPMCTWSVPSPCSADGAGMLRTQVAHRTPDERPRLILSLVLLTTTKPTLNR
jgi:hypothetical protein